MSALIGTRVIEFEGAHNFRDLGGYPSTLGGQVRWGMVFRAGRLDELTASDLVRLEALGLNTVFDLRRHEERDRCPDPIASIHLCLVSKMMELDLLPDSATLVEHDHGVEFMRDLYIGLLAHAGPEIGELFTTLANDGAPAMFHCTVGKDRTGVVAAVLLTLLGVERDIVLDDFELSERYVGQRQHEAMFNRMLERGMGPEAAAGMLGTSRASMASALDEIDSRYGGIESYARLQARLSDETISRLRHVLLA
jgi:protein-tyrosine phosphatase